MSVSKIRFGKINIRQIMYIILLIPFFPVQSIQMLGASSAFWVGVYNVLAVLRLLFAASGILYFLIKKKKPNVLTIGIVLAEEMTLIACYRNGSLTFQFGLTMCMATAGFSMLCQDMDEKSEKDFLRANIILFGVLCVLGALSIFTFPNGFNHSSQKQYAIWFLGSKNAAYFYYAQFLFLLCYDAKIKRKQIPGRVIVYALIFIASTLICRSSNGTLMLLVLLIGILAIKYKSFFRKLLNPRNTLIFVVLLAMAIPMLSSGAFDWAFKLIGRTSDFSMRTFIWDSAIEMILESPILGNGKDGDLVFFGRQSHAHNFYLDIAAKYGLLTIGIIVVTIMYITLKMRKIKNRELLYVGSLFILTLLVHSVFDVTSLFYLTMVLVYCLKIGISDRRINTRGIRINGEYTSEIG